MLIVIAVWFVSGFIAYGLDKGKHRDYLRSNGIKSRDCDFPHRDEIRHWFIALMGPVWPLAAGLVVIGNCFATHDLRFWQQLSFCLRIPKDLK